MQARSSWIGRAEGTLLYGISRFRFILACTTASFLSLGQCFDTHRCRSTVNWSIYGRLNSSDTLTRKVYDFAIILRNAVSLFSLEIEVSRGNESAICGLRWSFLYRQFSDVEGRLVAEIQIGQWVADIPTPNLRNLGYNPHRRTRNLGIG